MRPRRRPTCLPARRSRSTVHDALQSRTAFDESVNGDNLPPTRDRQTFAVRPARGRPGDRATAARVPDQRTRRQRRVPARGRPAQRHRRVARALRDPRRRRRRSGADGTLPSASRCNVAWVWPLQAEPAYLEVAGIAPINPTTLARTWSPSGRLGRQATAARRRTPTCRSPWPRAPRRSTRGARWRRSSPSWRAGPTAIRSTLRRNQVLAGPFVPLDLPSLERGGLGGRGHHQQRHPTERALAWRRDPRELLRRPRRPEHHAARPARRSRRCSTLQSASVRQLVVEGTALTPVVEKFTPGAPVQGAGGGGRRFERGHGHRHRHRARAVPHAATRRRPCAPRTSWPGSRSSPASSRASAAASPSPTRPPGTPTTRSSPTVLRRVAREPPRAPDDRARVPAGRAGGDRRRAARRTARRSASSRPTHRRCPRSRPAQYARGVRDRDAVASGGAGQRSNAPPVPTAHWPRPWRRTWSKPAGRAPARQLLRSIRTSVDAYVNQVEVQPPSTVTITSSKAEIPISFRNNEEQRGHGPPEARQRPPAVPRRRRARTSTSRRSTTRRCGLRSRRAARAPPRC